MWKGVYVDDLCQKQEKWRVTFPRWRHRLFLTLFPLTRRMINTIQKEAPLRESWNMGVKLKHAPVPQRPRQTALGGAERWLHVTALLLFKVSIAPLGEVSPVPLVTLVGKENLEGKPAILQHCGSLCRSPYSDLTPQGLQGNLWGSTPGNLTVMEKGGGAWNTQHMDVGRPSSYLKQC